MKFCPFVVSTIIISNYDSTIEATKKVIAIIENLTDKQIYVESFSATKPCVIILRTADFVYDDIIFKVFNIVELK